MKNFLIKKDTARLKDLLNIAWEICIQKIVNNRISINKEASLQLHYSSIINTLGEIYCTEKEDRFSIELESNIGNKNLDICCRLGSAKAASNSSSNNSYSTNYSSVTHPLYAFCPKCGKETEQCQWGDHGEYGRADKNNRCIVCNGGEGNFSHECYECWW
ncbi:MAG: hypothetical protein ACYDA4_15815 [Ignavibacteriaceae bacterium]